MVKFIILCFFLILNGCSSLKKDVVNCPKVTAPKKAAEVIVKSENKLHDFIISCLENNFDNYESMASLIHQFRFGTTEKDLGRKFGVICNLPGVLKV